MKKSLIIFSVLLSLFSFAQNEKHVKWLTEFKKTGDKEGEVLIKAEIEKGWHTYSQKPSDGPIPTVFKFKINPGFELIGQTEESAAKEEFDKTFDTKVYVFDEHAEFKQKIKLNASQFEIPITIEYMVCNDAMCIMEGPVNVSVQVK
ncbi:MAG: sugar transporter [Sphingobacteriaceae bacterium]|nr:sugar transporter [Sphingobacteriaceae bacterium]